MDETTNELIKVYDDVKTYEDFVINYEASRYGEEGVARDLSYTIINNYSRILTWFKLLEFPMFEVILYCRSNEFALAYRKYMNVPPSRLNYAFAKGRCIHILTYNEVVSKTDHRDMNYDEYLDTVLHEFVHLVFNYKYEITNHAMLEGHKWLKEGLACAIGNPGAKNLRRLNFDLKDITNDSITVSYSYYFTIVTYLMKYIPHDQLIMYITNINKLDDILPNMFVRMKNRSMNIRD